MTQREKATKLRREGKTCGEIVNILNTPKSTVWFWIKDLTLTDNVKRKIIEKGKEKSRKNIIDYNTKIRPVEAAKIRDTWMNEAKKEIKNISQSELKLIGSALYWAEGNTSNRNRLQISNCNPSLIKVSLKFFREICDVKDEKICARVHIYPGLDYKKALKFWSEVTNLPKKNFYTPQIQVSRASKGIMPRNTLPYGTLHLTILSTELASKVKGWIQGISEKI